MSAMTPLAASFERADAPAIFSLGIDVRTYDVAKLCRELGKLKSTVELADGGVYFEDGSYAQVHITTKLTRDELDDWLYETAHGCEYVGTFRR